MPAYRPRLGVWGGVKTVSGEILLAAGQAYIAVLARGQSRCGCRCCAGVEAASLAGLIPPEALFAGSRWSLAGNAERG